MTGLESLGNDVAIVPNRIQIKCFARCALYALPVGSYKYKSTDSQYISFAGLLLLLPSCSFCMVSTLFLALRNVAIIFNAIVVLHNT